MVTESSRALPMAGNLAWASLPGIDEVEVLDRFNGVPTLGIMKAGQRQTLFWRVLGYLGQSSAWLYVPLDAETAQAFGDEESDDLLAGFVFDSAVDRNACVGIASENRLLFEREWVLPARLGRESFIREVATFASEAMEVALRHELPPTRRHAMEQASRAVNELVRC